VNKGRSELLYFTPASGSALSGGRLKFIIPYVRSQNGISRPLVQSLSIETVIFTCG